jgi:hypothetical protein
VQRDGWGGYCGFEKIVLESKLVWSACILVNVMKV